MSVDEVGMREMAVEVLNCVCVVQCVNSALIIVLGAVSCKSFAFLQCVFLSTMVCAVLHFSAYVVILVVLVSSFHSRQQFHR
jgi:hypothetical protein